MVDTQSDGSESARRRPRSLKAKLVRSPSAAPDLPIRARSAVAAPGILDPETAAVDLITELLFDYQQRIRPRLALRARHHRPIGVELRRNLSQATHGLAEELLLNLDLVPLGDAGQVEGHEHHSNALKKANPKGAKP